MSETPPGAMSAEPEPDEVADVPGAAFLQVQLRKTKLCKYHLGGSCRSGAGCSFAHRPAELQSTPDLRKTRLCKAFVLGRCTSQGCRFAHGDGELVSTELFYKRSLCKWFVKNRCRNGAICRFAHGLSELHPVPDNEPPAVAQPPSGGQSIPPRSLVTPLPPAQPQLPGVLVRAWILQTMANEDQLVRPCNDHQLVQPGPRGPRPPGTPPPTGLWVGGQAAPTTAVGGWCRRGAAKEGKGPAGAPAGAAAPSVVEVLARLSL